MVNDFSDADLARIAVADAPVLDSDTLDRIQRLVAPHLAGFVAADPATVADLPAEPREIQRRAA